MIALYYLLVIAVWIWLTRLLWRLWRRACREAGAWDFVITPVFALAALAWLAVSFWYGGGRKYYYDAEVKRLCAIDGGVKVYETVKLPPGKKFNAWGQSDFFRPTQGENALGPEYIYEEKQTDYRKDNASKDGIKLFRVGNRIIRRSDKKLLGESAYYIRIGGDFPGSAFPSSFACPSKTGGLAMQVFIQ